MINRLYPGNPNYRGPRHGYFTLLHHSGPIVEWSNDVMERVVFIKRAKAPHEIPIRLRHIVFVPKKMQSKYVRDAYAKWQDAYAKWQDADAKYAKWQDAYAKWHDAYAKWQDAYAKWQDADKEQLLAYLHKHVKDCKWDGKHLRFD